MHNKQGSNTEPPQLLNNKPSALERTAAQPSGVGALNAIYWHQIFAPDSVVGEAQKSFTLRLPN